MSERLPPASKLQQQPIKKTGYATFTIRQSMVKPMIQVNHKTGRKERVGARLLGTVGLDFLAVTNDNAPVKAL